MNLEESNKIYQKNKQKNAKKQTIVGGIVVCIIIIVLCLLGILYLNAKEANRFKNILDGKEITLSENFIVNDEEGKQYVNIKQLSSLIGYKYNQGDYVKYNEDKESCYLENKYEIVTFKVNEKKFYKYMKNEDSIVAPDTNDKEQETKPTEIVYVVKTEDGEKETFSIESPIKFINEQIYIPLDIVNIACNSTIQITDKNLQIFSLDYLVQVMQQVAAQKKYETISSTYENLRAIPNNMLVVGNNSKYGVLSLETGELILTDKYDDVKYVQSEDKFYVYVNSKIGILDAKGNTIISPTDYESIKVFDEDKKLFLVQKDGKYGILKENGEFVLDTNFEAIGISNPEDYNTNELKNNNIWFDNLIAIKQSGKYALYDLEKNEFRTEFVYDGFGYKTNSTDASGEDSLLIVPEETGVKGICVNQNGLYGIYDIKVKDIVIPCACSKMYSVTTNGDTIYYMEFNGASLPMHQYFEEHNMITAK